MAALNPNQSTIDRIVNFQPVRLVVDQVGVFAQPFTLDLVDRYGQPSNFFMLASRNGYGKTTLLVAFCSLVECLGGFDGSFRQEDLNDGRGWAQLDVLVDLEIAGILKNVKLTITAGKSGAGLGWENVRIGQDVRNTYPDAAEISFRAGSNRPSANEIGKGLLRFFEFGTDYRPSRLFDDERFLPTVLSFPATRRVIRPPESGKAIAPPPDMNYRSLQVFDSDGANWETSLTNLLLWTFWLEPSRYEDLQKLVEESIFSKSQVPKYLHDVSRATLTPLIRNERGEHHRIDRLSHGERSMLQILVRFAWHMTGCTFLVIDEIELHLHPNWTLGLLNTLKRYAATRPVSVIFTTHSPELIEAFGIEINEQGLKKGGHIIDTEELQSA